MIYYALLVALDTTLWKSQKYVNKTVLNIFLALLVCGASQLQRGWGDVDGNDTDGDDDDVMVVMAGHCSQKTGIMLNIQTTKFKQFLIPASP